MKKYSLFLVNLIIILILFHGMSPTLAMEEENIERNEERNRPNFQLPRPRQDHRQYLENVVHQRPLKILSLDGGGIRGLLEIVWLREIERRTGRPATDLFDVFVGTSTGGIIAAGLAAGVTVENLLTYYRGENRQIIFDKTRREEDETHERIRGYDRNINTVSRSVNEATTLVTQSIIRSVTNAEQQIQAENHGRANFGVTLAKWAFVGSARLCNHAIPQGTNKISEKLKKLYASKYPATGAERAFRREFGESFLGDLHKPVLITSTELNQNGTYQLYMFNSIEAQRNDRINHKVWEALRATSAAPTYFPPLTLQIENVERKFVDGGVLCNNPAYKGYSFITRLYPNANIQVFSLSTGEYYNTNEHHHLNGELSWALPMINATMQEQSNFADEALRDLLPNSYYRIHTTSLTGATAEMDNFSEANLNELERIAREEIVGEERANFDRFINALQQVE